MVEEQGVLVPETNFAHTQSDQDIFGNTHETYPRTATQFEKECINSDDEARAYYAEHGAQECIHAFALAEILVRHKKPYEAACLYGLCYRLHSKSQKQFPDTSTLLLSRLLCFLKAGKELPEHDMHLLAAQAPVYARYVDTMRTIWRGQAADLAQSLRGMGNAFEEFVSGEEIDQLYLEQAKQVQPSVFERHTGHEGTVKAIPPLLCLYWDKEPPPEIMENIYFHQGIPDLDLKIFNHDEAVDWLYRFYGTEARDFFLSMRSAAEAANFFKLHATNLYGGWWLNTTLRLAGENALDFVLQEQSDVALFLTPECRVNDCFFGTTQQSGVMQECLLILYENCYKRKHLYPEYKTGAGVFGRALSRRAYRVLEGVESNEHIKLYSPEQLNTLVYRSQKPA